MKETPDTFCKHCLPDCRMTSYQGSISYSSFRRCDTKSLELSHFCKFNPTLDTPIWGNDLIQEVITRSGANNKTPGWIKSASSLRNRINGNSFTNQVFETINKRSLTYDAYHDDIAVATFYFDSPTSSHYMRDARMTVIDFISQLGGLAGVCIGMSLMSLVELIYWFTIRLITNPKG